ncbi:leucine zipper protein 1 [Polyodon spathula]|uniref:leucine zipper protein 1 n=1 Tax=Polyodon spathula TaxID=7913 RepID=UPI001B7E5662|nr:leucine zipper protein 1 [Polyodon spathula]XP_041089916.1 leucine zipper protein 1 [Polyodon spathula]XP_041089917.1 leucine zipper protein 1 [Polyodon spathula]XP_041089918.1 leucine zipper protein 1 [Polyodon spathula]XP_041089919.1 leucine zipper protein 1 [Polyodon spathula]XP_041089920.1 leucine zipper protein 1 [Polyodon spathula]XP_041089922.1 leucine zipper protein 1 [Polyodon spathula]XP_041089923.1 leucine zipper protein 1 [Polyodon spathula]
MADVTSYKDTTSRHLRHKLQSLGRRLDELEEATKNLQKAEDELLDLQDKVIQVEGSNSSLLNDVDAMRKRVLKIEGKDEEVRKAEELCRLFNEKMGAEENMTKELKTETERLQRRMAEMETLEEAFSKSKSDCTQLCLSLNEEKNLTKKLASELETFKARLKEIESSESRLDKAEQSLVGELEKLKSFTLSFVNERKSFLEKQKRDEQLIQELTQKLEQNNRINLADQSRNASNLLHRSSEIGDLRIEDDLSPGMTTKVGMRKKSLDYLKLSDDVGLRNKSENIKNSSEGQEDNKVKDLNQEIERLKNRLKQLELVEEELKNSEAKNGELQEKFQMEKNHNKALSDQMEQLKVLLSGAKILENGKAENEEINVRGGFRQEKPKYRSGATDQPVSKTRELSPQQRRERIRNRDYSQPEESCPQSVRRALSPSLKSRRAGKAGTTALVDTGVKERGRGVEEKVVISSCMSTSISQNEVKKTREVPSVLSRYPPAANVQNVQKPWKTSSKTNESDGKNRAERLYPGSDLESVNTDALLEKPNKSASALLSEKQNAKAYSLDQPVERLASAPVSKSNGSALSYRSHSSSLPLQDNGSESPSSASETESTGSRHLSSLGEPEPSPEVTALSGRSSVSSRYTRYARLQNSVSEGSSARSSFEEETARATATEGMSSEATHTPTGIEIRRVCSPREALRSKAVIKPAIVEIDCKEVMSGTGVEPLISENKSKTSTKSVSKMSSSITIYPSEPSLPRSSCCSSNSSDAPKERHTSTSNIVITARETPNTLSIPYEIAIPKSEFTLKSSEEAEDFLASEDKIEAQVSRSSFTIKALEPMENNNNETSFESSSSSSSGSWRSHQSTMEESSLDVKKVTVRSTWRTKQGAFSVDEGKESKSDAGDEDSDSCSTWRAYRATTVLDGEETSHTSKPSPAELYMRRINSTVGSWEPPEPVRRSKTESLLRKSYAQAHEPVTAQELSYRNRPKSPAREDSTDLSATSRRRQSPSDLGSVSKRQSSNHELCPSPGGISSRPPSSQSEGRGSTGRTWNHRQADN